MPTPHINAADDAFAQTVLMPGDPLRAKFIAETFLENAKEVTNVRGMLGFTGDYKGKKISVICLPHILTPPMTLLLKRF
jgi:Purine-nucleoside phosphorylase